LKWILGKPILRAWIGFVCFSIGISGGHLWILNFLFPWIRGNS
jgi:hypothetical protein